MRIKMAMQSMKLVTPKRGDAHTLFTLRMSSDDARALIQEMGQGEVEVSVERVKL